MYKNELYVGSVQDFDNVWHPIITSPDEDFVRRYCEEVAERSNGGFYEDNIDVVLIPIIITADTTLTEVISENMGMEDWEEIDESELYEDIMIADLQNGQ